MTLLKQIWRGLDTVFEALGLLCLCAVLLVVLWQVWDRQVLGSTPGWTEETARILMVWIGFLMTALGFREGAHIALTFVVDRFPPATRRIVEWLSPLLALLFGLYLIYQASASPRPPVLRRCPAPDSRAASSTWCCPWPGR